MVATDAERSRAARLRRAVATGRANATQRLELEDYNRNHPGRQYGAPAPAAAPQAPIVASLPPVQNTDVQVTSMATNAPLPDALEIIDAPAFVPHAAPAMPHLPAGMPTAPASTCPAGPDCPRCRAASGGMVCSTTGERVYPKMTVSAAKGMAGSLLAAVCIIARMFGKDVSPTEAEINELAEPLREVVYQHAGAMGENGHWFALIYVGGMFAMRVYTAPNVKPAA